MTAAPRHLRDHIPDGPLLTGVAVGGAVTVLYLLHLTPGPGWYDSPELSGVAHVLGIAHPTGYPLWSLAGRLASLLLAFLEQPAVRSNVLAALAGGATVGAMVPVAWRLGGLLGLGPVPRAIRYAAAMVPALVFAALPLFVAQSLSAEVYTLHTLFAVLLLLVGLGCALEAEGLPVGSRVVGIGLRNRTVLLAYLAGLGLAGHATLVLYLPALGLLVWWSCRPECRLTEIPTEPRMVPRRLVGLLGLALVAGLSLYLFVPLRALGQPPFDWGGADTLRGLVRLLTAAEIRAREAQFDPVTPLTIWGRLGEGFGLPAVVLAVSGWVWTGLRRPRLGLVGAVWFLSPLLFLLLGLDMLEDALLPFHLALALGLGALLLLVAERLVAWVGPLRGGWSGGLLAVLFLLAGPTGRLGNGWSELAVDRQWGPTAWSEAVTASAAGAVEPSPETEAVVFAEDNTTAFALWYQERVAGLFQRVHGIYLLLAREEWYRRVLRRTVSGLVVPEMRREIEDQPHTVAGRVLVEANRSGPIPVLLSPIALPPGEEYGALVPQGLLLRIEPPGYEPTGRDLQRHAELVRRYTPAFQEQVPQLDPQSRDIWSSRHQLLGEAWARLGALEPARIEYQAAIRINPGRVQTWYAYGQFLKAIGDWPQAEQAFSNALDLVPGDPILNFEVVGTLARQGAYARADSMLPEVEPPETERWEYLQLRALIRGGLGRIGPAERDLREAAGLNPASGSVQNDLGVLLLRRGEDEEAQAAFQRATELEPDLPEGWANLGSLALQAGRMTEAARLLERAVSAGATDPFVRWALGLALSRLGNLEGAQIVLIENLRAWPRHADTYLLLGDVQAAMGDLRGARATLELGRMSIPDDPRFARQLQRLGAPPPR